MEKMLTLISPNFQVYQAPECDDEPEGTLFSWFGPIWFLPHQKNVMDHGWVLAMNHICENKKSCLYVHTHTKKNLAKNFPGFLIPH